MVPLPNGHEICRQPVARSNAGSRRPGPDKRYDVPPPNASTCRISVAELSGASCVPAENNAKSGSASARPNAASPA